MSNWYHSWQPLLLLSPRLLQLNKQARSPSFVLRFGLWFKPQAWTCTGFHSCQHFAVCQPSRRPRAPPAPGNGAGASLGLGVVFSTRVGSAAQVPPRKASLHQGLPSRKVKSWGWLEPGDQRPPEECLASPLHLALVHRVEGLKGSFQGSVTQAWCLLLYPANNLKRTRVCVCVCVCVGMGGWMCATTRTSGEGRRGRTLVQQWIETLNKNALNS